MGILDHQRTWHFETTTSPGDCVQAFTEALNGRGMSLMGSNWRISDGGDDAARRAVATYAGRGGMGAVSLLSRRSAQEQDAAIGSRMVFTATAGAKGTTCTMHMSEVTKVWLFITADARFFRSAMNRVARKLRAQDAGLALVKQ